MRHMVQVEAPSEAANAGEIYTLSCTVYSDLPVVVTWLGPQMIALSDHTISTTHENFTSVSGDNLTLSTSNITFDPLQPSHGGVYTCQSVIDISSPRNSLSQTHLLQIQRMFEIE